STVWPMFGAANQLLGTLALCIGTTLFIKMGKARYLWVTAVPMVFVGIITLTGCHDLWWIFLDRARTAADPMARVTMGLNAALVGLVAVLALVVLTESATKWYHYLVLKQPYTTTEIIDGEGIRIPEGKCC
ncbi:MAG: carbon starvation protein A, partial [Nitrospira sp. SB0678_bin_10]|nr:carbon starvation protein A [Nitrospira sp. SB0678_bin_10]